MFNVSIIQANLHWENAALNRELFTKAFKQIPNNTHLVVLPEMFTTGFTMHPEPVAETMLGETVAWLKASAQRLNATIAGSIIIKESESYYNRLLVAQPNGDLSFYDKRHLFRYADEHLNFSNGNKELILNINGTNVAFFICYDLRFPVWSRNVNLKYDVAVYVANWPKKRLLHWVTLLKARAIENQSFIVGVNRSGVDGNAVEYAGESLIFNAMGAQIAGAQNCEISVESVALDVDNLKEYREKFPAFLDSDYFELK